MENNIEEMPVPWFGWAGERVPIYPRHVLVEHKKGNIGTYLHRIKNQNTIYTYVSISG